MLSVHPSSDPFLESLNPAQRKAVETTQGAVLVLAGAGTGKTRVLTTRLAYLLRKNLAYPSQILAVTFTNKAAAEMRARVSSHLNGAAVEGWWLGTFHALAARMLRRHAELVGLTSTFTIIDQDDQVRLIKQLMEDQGIDVKKTLPKMMADQISAWKDKALLPHDGEVQAEGSMASSLYAHYQARLRALNVCDFGNLLLHMITIFKDPRYGEVLADYHRRFKYLLVDEYQDTNVAQYLWLRLLAKGSGNLCCVGDDDQSIYGWRGAEVENILRFEKDFPGAVIIRLEENYRSTGHILAAANGVIAHNDGRLGKALFTSAGYGDKVFVRGLWDGEAEARWVCEEIESLQQKQYALNEMAVLVRAGFQTRGFEERFIQMGIPYRVIGGQRFYERMEVRDALAYLRVTMQSSDDLALERIINTPKRGLGDQTIQTLYAHARSKGISLYESIRDLCQTDEIKPKQRAALMKLIDDFERWRMLIPTTPHPALASMVLEESGYTAMWQADKSPDAPGRVENLKELVSGMEDFDSLQHFLEHVALVFENQDSSTGEQVSIMTLHAAKGLEFDVVFLTGWEDGLFPSQRSMDENGLKGLEEERRLAYVGITRAKKKSYISHAANRRMYGSWINAIPSRFIDELPPAHIEVLSDSGLYGGVGRSSHWDSSGMQARSVPSRGIVSEGETATDGYVRGDRVSHDKFGIGKIVNVDGNKLDILFDQGGLKRVIESFVRKT